MVHPESTWICKEREDSWLVGSWNISIPYVQSFQARYIEVEHWWCHSVQTQYGELVFITVSILDSWKLREVLWEGGREEKFYEWMMVEVKNRAFVDNRNKTSLDELQHVLTLDLRLNNINFCQFLSFIIYINLNHHCWTSESLLNL